MTNFDPYQNISHHHETRAVLERTAIVERDLYHLDQRVMVYMANIENLSERLHDLSDRVKTAETVLDSSLRDIQELSDATEKIKEKVPDMDRLMKIVGWMMDIMKYAIGLAIIVGAITGKLSWGALSQLVTP